MRIVVTASLLVTLALCTSCVSTTVNATPTAAPAASVPVPGAIDEAVKDAVAEQLQCPKADIIFLCDERDRTGECIAVHAKGCEKELAYKFGTD